MEFWNRFDYLCARKGVSKRKACEDMGFSASLAAKGKHAGTMPRPEFIFACASYFSVTADYLMGKEESPTEADDPVTTRQVIFENFGQRVLYDASKGCPSSKLVEFAAAIEQWKEENGIGN